MDKERLFVFLSSLNENYQSFKFAGIESKNKFDDFINILEDKYYVSGGIKYNLINEEEEILLRNLLKVDYIKLEKTNERKSE